MASTEAILAKIADIITNDVRLTLKKNSKFSRHFIRDSNYNFNETPWSPKVSANWIPDLIAEKQITIAGSNVS